SSPTLARSGSHETGRSAAARPRGLSVSTRRLQACLAIRDSTPPLDRPSPSRCWEYRRGRQPGPHRHRESCTTPLSATDLPPVFGGAADRTEAPQISPCVRAPTAPDERRRRHRRPALETSPV